MNIVEIFKEVLELSDKINPTSIFTAVITTFLLQYVSHKKELKNKREVPDLSEKDFEDHIKPILEIIREKLGAHRVTYWEGSNGTVTLSNYHLKTLSILAESCGENTEEIKYELERVPVSKFKRTMDYLRDGEEMMYSLEHRYNDDLAKLNKGFDTNTIIFVKVRTTYNKWTGILSVGFKEEAKIVDEEDLAWLKVQASRIGAIIKKSFK